MAISLSEKGSEDGTLHFSETATGRHLPDTIPGVQYPTGGGGRNADGLGVLHALSPAGRNVRKPISISINKCGFTNSARRRGRRRQV
jgi:hypothetical protein